MPSWNQNFLSVVSSQLISCSISGTCHPWEFFFLCGIFCHSILLTAFSKQGYCRGFPLPSLTTSFCQPKQPLSCIELELAICFIYDIIHVSMTFFQIIPPFPSPTESKTQIYRKMSGICEKQTRDWRATEVMTAFLRPPKVPRHAGFPRGEHRGSRHRFL